MHTPETSVLCKLLKPSKRNNLLTARCSQNLSQKTTSKATR